MNAPALPAGYVVAGKYTLRSLLLHGGAMASYRAVAAKNREVVVKLYDPAIASAFEVSAALAQHKSIGAKLPPQEIVPIADGGTDSNSGALFTVTDFESAPSLAQLIEKHPLSTMDVALLVHNLARVTDRLHANGVTSLSLHPGNVFVRPGTHYEVRIADFGASMVRAALPPVEKAGRWMPWLAPEQLKGHASGQAADVFALGLIAFFAVTGKSYWRSSQVKTPDVAALRREILSERMPASVRASEFSINLNPAADVVFARALGFRSTERYATAREFAIGLDAALSGRSVADVEAAHPPMANIASANGKAPEDGPASRDSSTGTAGANAQRLAAPPPRKMLPRATMLGVGNQPVPEPTAAPAPPGGPPRKPMTTMLGMGESAAQAVAAAKINAAPAATVPQKPPPPAVVNAQPKGPPPARTFATPPASPAKIAPFAKTMMMSGEAPMPPPAATARRADPPPLPMTPAPAQVDPFVARDTTARRADPPPLPMVPPPAQMEAVLASFEASGPVLASSPNSPAPPAAMADVAPTPPAWSIAEPIDVHGDRVETGVAVIGTATVERPKRSRKILLASIGGVLVLTAGAALALSGGRSSNAHGPPAAGGKASAVVQAAATTSPVSADPPSTAAPTPNPNAAPAVEEPRTGVAIEPVAAAPPPAPPQEPVAAEPAPVADSNAAAQPATAPVAPVSTATPRTGAAGPRAQPKPCGKFLKRCK